MNETKLLIEQFDTLTVSLNTKTDNKKNEELSFDTKKVIFGFNQLPSELEKYILENNDKLNLNKEIKFVSENKKNVYKFKILKLKKASQTEKNDKQMILDLRQKLLKSESSELLSNVKIMNLEKENKKNIEEFKKKVEAIQLKAHEELEAQKSKNYEHLQQESANFKKYATQSFMEDFVVAFDQLDLAVKSGFNLNNDVVQSYAKGFTMLLSRIEKILEENGVQKIIPEIGSDFNPHTQQVFELADQGQPKDKILKVKSNGYKLHDRVIKPALVIVQK
ncbi:nucleotide exchange factor GrpE [[Mycoplasma] gypis]|uniref:Protein GrpE n=1 Tax=[Mycoplasma] gypis TaxID=92404 RepID=A0ABZ2RQ80_9BACT|nr:nucleotide exchange factor GrpE [[Mycoplasma] gypis]MBN0919040.1 nucleotide exchange factor GrpE [[Mycoplasma] gypis]